MTRTCVNFYKFFLNFIKNLVYPNFCAYCKDFLQENNVFCKTCYNAIKPVVTTTVEVTKKYKVKVFAISDYKFPVKSLVLAKGGSDIIASRKLGQLAWELTYIKNADFDFIVPIPLHWKRYAERGFNQAQEMANVISSHSGKPVINLLKRRKSTRRQSELSPSNRVLNLYDAFELNLSELNLSELNLSELNLKKLLKNKSVFGKENKKIYENKKILLVDDLLTTGSTIKAATKILIELKPSDVKAIVACRVI